MIQQERTKKSHPYELYLFKQIQRNTHFSSCKQIHLCLYRRPWGPVYWVSKKHNSSISTLCVGLLKWYPILHLKLELEVGTGVKTKLPHFLSSQVEIPELVDICSGGSSESSHISRLQDGARKTTVWCPKGWRWNLGRDCWFLGCFYQPFIFCFVLGLFKQI